MANEVTKLSAEQNRPVLPVGFRFMLSIAPAPVKHRIITMVLNELFKTAAAEGDLDFVRGHRINIVVADAGLKFCVGMDAGKLVITEAQPKPDLSITGNVHTFLLLATRSEDPDTLFFNRILKTEGDTDLGLYLKNFLADLDPETLPNHTIVDTILRNALRIAEGHQRLIDALPLPRLLTRGRKQEIERPLSTG